MNAKAKPRIALFDYCVTPSNPTGGCNRRVLGHLADEFDFTVFAVEFDNPRPDRITFVRIPVPQRPLCLQFVCFHLVAPIYFFIHQLGKKEHFDIVEKCESNLLLGDISYAHFCHRSFLKNQWTSARPAGLRRPLRWLDHFFHSLLEPFVYRRTKCIVVPSQGLRRELTEEYPDVAAKVKLIYNPVDLDHMAISPDFDRQQFRQALGFSESDIVLLFAALGQFERKGLPQALAALKACNDTSLKLLVVGGTSDLVAEYAGRVERMGLSGQVHFAGHQNSIRHHLWAADALVFPTSYEVFPLVALEAAAAGLPLIVTPVNGVEEFVVDGKNGIFVERSNEGVAEGLARFVSLTQEERRKLGEQARRDVAQYSVSRFVSAWQEFYLSELELPKVAAEC
jgi:glycosyltransferase involved in cell wall biosynthesis